MSSQNKLWFNIFFKMLVLLTQIFSKVAVGFQLLVSKTVKNYFRKLLKNTFQIYKQNACNIVIKSVCLCNNFLHKRSLTRLIKSSNS